MSPLGFFRPYHFQKDLIWWGSPFTVNLKGQVSMAMIGPLRVRQAALLPMFHEVISAHTNKVYWIPSGKFSREYWQPFALCLCQRVANSLLLFARMYRIISWETFSEAYQIFLKTIQNSSAHNSFLIHIISWDWPFKFEIKPKKVAERDSVTLNAISYNILAFLRIAFMNLPFKCLFYSTIPFVKSHCPCSGHS
jgi:hypothetical protein